MWRRLAAVSALAMVIAVIVLSKMPVQPPVRSEILYSVEYLEEKRVNKLKEVSVYCCNPEAGMNLCSKKTLADIDAYRTKEGKSLCPGAFRSIPKDGDENTIKNYCLEDCTKLLPGACCIFNEVQDQEDKITTPSLHPAQWGFATANKGECNNPNELFWPLQNSPERPKRRTLMDYFKPIAGRPFQSNDITDFLPYARYEKKIDNEFAQNFCTGGLTVCCDNAKVGTGEQGVRGGVCPEETTKAPIILYKDAQGGAPEIDFGKTCNLGLCCNSHSPSSSSFTDEFSCTQAAPLEKRDAAFMSKNPNATRNQFFTLIYIGDRASGILKEVDNDGSIGYRAIEFCSDLQGICCNLNTPSKSSTEYKGQCEDYAKVDSGFSFVSYDSPKYAKVFGADTSPSNEEAVSFCSQNMGYCCNSTNTNLMSNYTRNNCGIAADELYVRGSDSDGFIPLNSRESAPIPTNPASNNSYGDICKLEDFVYCCAETDAVRQQPKINGAGGCKDDKSAKVFEGGKLRSFEQACSVGGFCCDGRTDKKVSTAKCGMGSIAREQYYFIASSQVVSSMTFVEACGDMYYNCDPNADDLFNPSRVTGPVDDSKYGRLLADDGVTFRNFKNACKLPPIVCCSTTVAFTGRVSDNANCDPSTEIKAREAKVVRKPNGQVDPYQSCGESPDVGVCCSIFGDSRVTSDGECFTLTGETRLAGRIVRGDDGAIDPKASCGARNTQISCCPVRAVAPAAAPRPRVSFFGSNFLSSIFGHVLPPSESLLGQVVPAPAPRAACYEVEGKGMCPQGTSECVGTAGQCNNRMGGGGNGGQRGQGGGGQRGGRQQGGGGAGQAGIGQGGGDAGAQGGGPQGGGQGGAPGGGGGNRGGGGGNAGGGPGGNSGNTGGNTVGGGGPNTGGGPGTSGTGGAGGGRSSDDNASTSVSSAGTNSSSTSNDGTKSMSSIVTSSQSSANEKEDNDDSSDSSDSKASIKTDGNVRR